MIPPTNEPESVYVCAAMCFIKIWGVNLFIKLGVGLSGKFIMDWMLHVMYQVRIF